MSSPRVLVVAGEISGDLHAANLVRAAQARRPDIQFFGIGGDELQKCGMEILHHARDMAVLGLWEVLKRYGFFRKVFDDLVRVARERRPDAVLLVDYPGFNLRFAAEMKKLGVRVVYYVCPQVWAWHRSRIPKMAKIVDRLLCIFPFEPAVFAGTGLRADFVGHPLVDEARRALAEPPADLPWPGEPRVALLPGSRRQEIQRILPMMLEAAAQLDAGYLLAAASDEMARLSEAVLADAKIKPARLRIVVGATRQILRQARAAMVASGTATLETALMGCPMVVLYRTSAVTYFLGKRLVQVPHLGMVNLIAGRELCPEFIQHADPKVMADTLRPLVGDTPERRAMTDGLQEVVRALGGGGAADRAATALLDELR